MAAKKSENTYTATTTGRVVKDTGDVETRKVNVSEVPDGTVAEVEQWVAGDKARAAAAIEAEEAKGDDARTTLVRDLKRVVNEETGAGIASGEA